MCPPWIGRMAPCRLDSKSQCELLEFYCIGALLSINAFLELL